MKKIVIIGLGSFARRMLDALSDTENEILIIDTNKDRINENKSKATSAYITNISNLEALRKIVPDKVDAAVIDSDEGFETTLLVTHLLRKLNISNLIVRAMTEEQEEILKLTGADFVVLPDRESAQITASRLIGEQGNLRFDLSQNLSISQITVPKKLFGEKAINLETHLGAPCVGIAVIKEGTGDFVLVHPDYVFCAGDGLLLAGDRKNLTRLIGTKRDLNFRIGSLFNRIFHR